MRIKILSILFLLGFVLPSVTSYLLYKIERNIAFSEFSIEKKFLSSEHVRIIRINNQSTINWEKKDKEFLLGGKLYDVLTIKRNGMAVEITCVPDTKEDQIVKSYLKCCDQSKNKNNKAIIPSVKDKLCVHDDFTPPIDVILYTNVENVLTHPIVPSPWLEIFSPPPEPYSSLFVS